MIPIRDTTPSKSYPLVNSALIFINLFVFLLEIFYVSDVNQFLFLYGFVPARYTVPEVAVYFTVWEQMLSFFSFMFLHGGIWHLIGNMWFLYIFGDNIEDRLGHIRYLMFYVLCGLTSALAHFIFNLHSYMPTIGASGAIAGVMGAYFVLYPRARVLTLIPIIFIPYFIEIPAAFFLGLWLLLQFLNAAVSDPGMAGIAWWAHIGGFLFGIIFLKIFIALPELGISARVRPATLKTKSPRLHVVKSEDASENHNLYGKIVISPQEALQGARKLITIPGFQHKAFLVNVPASIHDGAKLRLAGLGKENDEGRRGDLYLTIKIAQDS